MFPVTDREEALPGVSPATIVGTPPETREPGFRWAPPSGAFVTVVLWLAGVLLVMLAMGRALRRLWGITLRARPLEDAAWTDLVDAVSRKSRWRRRVTLRASDEIEVPMTWGAWRPVVLLPTRANTWDDRARRSVLTHELAHVERGDWLRHMAGQRPSPKGRDRTACPACRGRWFGG